MRRVVTVAVGLILLPFFLVGAAAQTERYRLERTEDGYVRMDTETGAMTLCQERGGELVCRSASEENSTEDADTVEVEALRERVAKLEERVQALEKEGADLPTEDEFERSLGLMERFFNRFVDIVKGLQQKLEPDQGEQTAPSEQRT